MLCLPAIHKTVGEHTYTRNLGNTAATVLLAIPLITTLYCVIRFPALNKTMLDLSSDVVVSVSNRIGGYLTN